MDIKFKTPYSNRPGRFIHPPCPVEEDDYILDESINKLVKCGTIPIYERIQSYHESTLLSYKLRRYTLGDSMALGTPGGTYGDFTNIPNSVQEVLQLQANIQARFNDLPEDIRAVFNNNFKEFYDATVGGTAERRISEALRGNSSGSGSSSSGVQSSQSSAVNGSITGGNE